ncbi:Xaa-Pro aminopeptidase [uncultured Paraglaciecola sp.]|mgnify:CR=1 FL=1|uniref:Xaa-Pro aminopeptidase n=1 Tax=uncultured Paraglaciecola sp. TaxID=1765024 RepID=UPI0030DCD592|tara:strand:+ start:15575 stop:16894 length:1320 start_codon:yes stop_codon:yes gene_type:complete
MDNSEFLSRQTHLLHKMQPNSICLLPASGLVTRSRDTEFPFRQDSYFHYLCGFPEPDAWLVLSNHQEYSKGMSVLFCLDKDPTMEIWHGRRVGPKQAKQQYPVNMAFAEDELGERLLDLIDGHQNLYFAQGHNPNADELVFSLLQALRDAPKQSRQAPASLIDSRIILDEMRLFKSTTEIELMRKAAAIATQAHMRAMRFVAADKNEYHLEAEIHHEFAMQGAKYPAYGTIVGAGDNACILHYTENNQVLKDGDLVLIDAGCEWQGYAADITRTFPVSGQFSEQQKQLYELVLRAQLAAFEQIKPNNTIKQASDVAVAVITQGLLDLDILKGDLTDNIKQQNYREFYMHGLSHWLGLDVHDVGNYKIDGQDRPLKPGMVLTVEPGIYIAPDAKVDNKWRGIGIRIEDNLLITTSGYENLTLAAPKTINDIEALMLTKSG